MGTKLSMSNPNPGIWFKFDETDPQSGEVGVRPLTPAERDKIRKKAIKKRVEYKKGQRFEVEDVNEDLFSELLWDYSITGWTDLEDDDGREIKCSNENKVFLMRNHVGFARFVAEKMEQLSEEYETKLSAENANLLSGSSVSGTLTDPTVSDAES